MLIPELPDYLTSLGGADYKGLIISLFTLTAMLSRPFSGKLADKLGRIPVMMFGAGVCFICSLIYPVATTVFGFLTLRLIHGFSTGFTPTGAAAYLSDIIPVNKRGEAMGIVGTAGTLGMAGGPAIGGAIANNFGLDAMFYCSSGFALIAVIIVISIKETITAKQKFSASLFKIKTGDIFEPRVLAPCLIMVLTAYAYGAMFTVIPDFGSFVGIKNKGLLFTFLTVASLLVRLLAGKASDRFGRVPVLKLSTLLMMSSMIVVGFASDATLLIIGVSLYGLAQGTTSPTLLAWATDLSDEQHRGRGIASLYIFMEFGIGMGALLSGLIYGNQSSHFFITFITCAALSLLAFVYLMTKHSHSTH